MYDQYFIGGLIKIKSVLIVEDDKGLCNGISIALQNNELEISKAYDLSTAKGLLKQQKFDLIILDVNLPDGNGLDFLGYVKNTYDADVIILTANDLEIDIVTGLEMGADDYITKPFSLAILRARVNTQLRKNNENIKNVYTYKNLVFDFDKMEYTKDNKFVELSKTEQKLLNILIANKGNTVTRDILIDKIWGNDVDFVDDNSLSVAIKRLRDKLEDNQKKPKYVKTIYGIGYAWGVK